MSGTDESISATKIQPLDSPEKRHTAHAKSDQGVVGTDQVIDSSHLEPFNTEGHQPHAPQKEMKERGQGGMDMGGSGMGKK